MDCTSDSLVHNTVFITVLWLRLYREGNCIEPGETREEIISQERNKLGFPARSELGVGQRKLIKRVFIFCPPGSLPAPNSAHEPAGYILSGALKSHDNDWRLEQWSSGVVGKWGS